MDPLEDPELPALVSAALEQRDRGFEPRLDELCAARPDLREAVAEALRAGDRLPVLQRSLAGRDALLGRTLAGRYRLVERLGAGAMGVVYEAQDLELGRLVAVKILRALVLDDEEAALRFEREGEALASVHHPCVVTIHDRGRTEDGDPFLVMERLHGRPLADLLEGGSGPDQRLARLGSGARRETSWLRQTARWAAELAEGLEAVHRAGVLHRDVKPSNVFLCTDGRVVLLDFGIAHVDREDITRDGAFVGTPAYMAPECLARGGDPSAAQDVYGLSATLYHLLTSEPPYQGTPSQIMSALVRTDPPRASRLCQGLPRDLQAVLDRGMARAPRDRYASAAELGQDLRAFLDHRPVQARPLSALALGWRRLRRSPLAVGALVALVLVGLTLGGTALAAQRREQHAALAFEAYRRLPANFTVVHPPGRRLRDGALRARVQQHLDRLVEFSASGLPARLLRASFRLDHGDAAGAAADVEALAQELGSPLSRTLADRYAALPPGSEGVDALDLEGLPEPRDARDLLVAGYHRMRVMDRKGGCALLMDPRLADEPYALELSLPAHARDGLGRLELALELERRLGGRTATTANFAAGALVLDRRYERALEVALEGLELSPASVPLLENAGLAAWRLRRMDEADDLYAEAVRLDPESWMPWEYLVRVRIDAWRFAAAREALAAAPFAPVHGPEGELLHGTLTAELETEQALERQRAGDPVAAREAARRADEHFARVLELDPGHTSSRMAIARSILEETSSFAGLADLMAEDLSLDRRLRILVEWMPAELDTTDTAALRAMLRAVADRFESDQRDPDPAVR